MMKVALLSDLEGSRFHEDPNRIGGPKPVVKLFDSEESAIDFAVAMIVASEPAFAMVPKAEALEDFQFSLCGLEYFHVRPVVQE